MASSTYVRVPGYYWDRDLNNGVWEAPPPTVRFNVDHEYVLKKNILTPKVRSTAQQNQENQEAADETAESLTKLIENLDGSRKAEVQGGEHWNNIHLANKSIVNTDVADWSPGVPFAHLATFCHTPTW